MTDEVVEGASSEPKISPEDRAKVDELLQTANTGMTGGMEDHPSPSRLYHFTDANGVIGILTSKTLWASRAMSLNDASEINYGIDVVKQYLEDRMRTSQLSMKRMAFLDSVKGWLDPTPDKVPLVTDIEHFVVSFCAYIDKSTHWLHYGRGGTGYAVGFDASQFPPADFNLVKVIYDPGEQRKFVDQGIKAIEEKFLTLAFNADDLTLRRLGGVASHLCATAIRAFSVRMKHPSFAAEEEWRLIAREFADPRFEFNLKHRYRTIGSRIVPYVLAEFGDKFPVTEIILGQAVDLRHAEGAFQFVFRKEGIAPAPAIMQSTVPVRPSL